MKKIGKVLWWDQGDQNGIIVDGSGNEFYFDISVIENLKLDPKPGSIVQFQVNQSMVKISCAKSVNIPPKRSIDRLEKEYQKSLQLSLPLQEGY